MVNLLQIGIWVGTGLQVEGIVDNKPLNYIIGAGISASLAAYGGRYLFKMRQYRRNLERQEQKREQRETQNTIENFLRDVDAYAIPLEQEKERREIK